MFFRYFLGLATTGLVSLLLINPQAEAQSVTAAFDQMRQATLASMEKGTTTTVQVKGPGGATEKLALVDQSAAPQGCVGVRIWGQLVDNNGNVGPFVNLTKFRWNPQQRFYLWIESAVPVQMALFQNYPGGLPASRQVSPDVRFPASFATIVPGQPFKFPIQLETDDNLLEEQISFIFVRADAQILPTNGGRAEAQASAQAGAQGTAQASAQASAQAIINTSTLPPNSTVQINAVANGTSGIETRPPTGNGLLAYDPNAGTLKGAALEGARQTFAAIKQQSETNEDARLRLKFRFVDEPTGPVQSQNNGDVSLVAIGPGNIAQIELTLHK